MTRPLPQAASPQDRSGTRGPQLTIPLLCVHLDRPGQSPDWLLCFPVLSSKRLSQQEGGTGDGENSKKMLKKRSNL